METEDQKNTKNDARNYLPKSKSIYRSNLEALGRDFAGLLLEAPEEPVKIESDIRIGGLNNPSYLVVAGFSTSKVLRKALQVPNKQIGFILIIEPSLRRFHATIQREYIGDLCEDPRVDFLIGIEPENIVPHLYKIFTRSDNKLGPRCARALNPELIFDPFVYSSDNPESKQILDAVSEGSKQAFLAMGCTSDSFYRWERMMQNAENIQDSIKVSSWFDKFKEVPAIVLGAGPSLKEFIDVYKTNDIRDRYLIISCDAALGLLLQNKIRPHFVLRCERKDTEIFRGVGKEDTKGIYYSVYPWGPPRFNNLFDKRVSLFRDNGVCRWAPFDPGAVNGGVSSANAGVELALRLGCKHVYFSGIDLVILDGKTHIEGTMVEFDPMKSKAKHTEVLCNDGETRTTIPVWRRCAKEYEGSIMKHEASSPIVHNTSNMGIKINGAPYKGWDEIIPMHKTEHNIWKRLERAEERHPPDTIETFHKKRKEGADLLRKAKWEMKMALGNIADASLIARREEDKIVEQLKGFIDSYDFFMQTESALKALVKVYTEGCRHIDNFKKAWFADETFSQLILDQMQHTYFVTENRCNALTNTVPIEHHRLREYVNLSVQMFKEMDYYMERMIEILETGKPNQSVDYRVTPESYWLKREAKDDPSRSLSES